MPMVRVLAQTDVGHHDDIWRRLLDHSNRLLDDTVFFEGPASNRVLLRRQAEKNHRRDPECPELLRLGGGLSGRQAKDAGHGGNHPIRAGILADEKRLHKTVRIDRRLSDERAQGCGAPQPSQPISRTREVSHGLEPPQGFR